MLSPPGVIDGMPLLCALLTMIAGAGAVQAEPAQTDWKMLCLPSAPERPEVKSRTVVSSGIVTAKSSDEELSAGRGCTARLRRSISESGSAGPDVVDFP